MKQPVTIFTFGRFTICRNGQESAPPQRNGDLLCKALLCQPGRQAEGFWLAEQLWPLSEGDRAIEYLYAAVKAFRAATASDLLVTHRQTQSYHLVGQDRLWVDADAAVSLLAEAEGVGLVTEEALPRLEQAVQLFRRGRFLAGVEETWVQARRLHLETMKERALVWLAEAYRQGGKMAQAEALLAEALAEDPTNENLLCHLMQTLHEEGMTHQALRAYDAFVKALRNVGLEPAEATTSLYRRLKRAPRVLDPSALPMSPPLSLPSSSLAEQHQEHASQARETTGPLTIPAVAQDSQTVLLPLFTEAVKRGILQAAGKLGSGRRSEAPATQQTGSTQSLESDLSVDRREATKQIGSLLTLFATPDVLSPLQPLLQLADTSKDAGIDEETLDSFAHLNEICRQLSEGRDLKMAESILWTYLPKVELIARLSSQHQHTAARIAAHGYLLAASLAGHRNDLRARKQLSEQALLHADLAHDPTLHVAALRQLALTFDYLERPDKVLQTYEQTVPLLHDVSPLLRSCVYAGMSGAYAQQRQQPEADRFLDLAYEHFPETSGNEAGFLQITCRLSTLIFWEGLNHLAFDRPAEAEKVFARIDGRQPKMPLPERVRAELLSYQAHTFTALQDMEQACTYLEAAVQAATDLGSKIRLQDSLAVFRQMWSLWRHEPQVQALVDLVMQASSVLYLR